MSKRTVGFMPAGGSKLISPDVFPNAKKMVELAKTCGAYQIS